ncbi:MAG TPA: DNA polymerase III subunit beta [Rugosimonospora sp.]|nr:DNA polymerase III subunit beta [Rugosimonospora sp.]
MWFRIDRDALADAVGWAARCLPGRPAAPVLAGMLLEVAPTTADQLTLACFDYQVAAHGQVPIEALGGADGPGRALVSGRLLAEITRNLPAAPVDIRAQPGRVVLRCAGTRFTLATLPVEDYPRLPDPPPLAGAVGSDSLATAIGQVVGAAARDDAVPLLTAVRVELRGETLSLSCSDRFRVAVRELPWRPVRAHLSSVALVPVRTLASTARWLAGAAEVTITLSDTGGGLIGFECAGRQTVSRLLDQRPVDYVARFPRDFTGSAEIGTAPLLAALRRMSLVAAKHTPVTLAFHRDRVVLEAATGEEAHAVEELPALVAGPDVTVRFNPQFLLDGVSGVDSDQVWLRFTKAGPVLLSGKSTEYRYLLMPVRLPGD